MTTPVALASSDGLVQIDDKAALPFVLPVAALVTQQLVDVAFGLNGYHVVQQRNRSRGVRDFTQTFAGGGEPFYVRRLIPDDEAGPVNRLVGPHQRATRIGGERDDPEASRHLLREQFSHVQAAVPVPCTGNIVRRYRHGLVQLRQDTRQLSVAFGEVSLDESLLPVAFERVVERHRLCRSKRPVSHLRQASQRPSGSHVLVKETWNRHHRQITRGTRTRRGPEAQRSPHSAIDAAVVLKNVGQ